MDNALAPDGGACTPPEPGGAITFADCTKPYKTIFRGTLDGKPLDQTVAPSYPFSDQTEMPFSLEVNFQGGGYLKLFWDNVCLYADGAPVPVTGTLRLPNEVTAVHIVKDCSLLWKTYDMAAMETVYRFNLLLDVGDQLTGCAR